MLNFRSSPHCAIQLAWKLFNLKANGVSLYTINYHDSNSLWSPLRELQNPDFAPEIKEKLFINLTQKVFSQTRLFLFSWLLLQKTPQPFQCLTSPWALRHYQMLCCDLILESFMSHKTEPINRWMTERAKGTLGPCSFQNNAMEAKTIKRGASDLPANPKERKTRLPTVHSWMA